MMKRDECLAVIHELRGDAVVVAHFHTAFDMMRVAPHPLNYYSVGAMGQASSHGLGLALGMPDRKILVVDGDGSLLMNLGTLVTIVEAAPPNLIHFVGENGVYETNGSHPLPGMNTTDFPAFARAAGFQHVYRIETIEELREKLPEMISLRAPVFCSLVMVAGETSRQDWPYINGPQHRAEFAAGLQALGISSAR
jgi:sulfopyruvate decarboxylase subunit beta